MRTPLILLAVAAAAFSHAGLVLGIDNSGIYKINVATGASTLAASLTGHGTGDTNALAYNAANNTAYFQRNGKLWSANMGTGEVAATTYTIGTGADAATFYKGAYYYSAGKTINKIDFATAGSTVAYTFPTTYSFGDLAADGAGTFYGSADSKIFKTNLTGSPTILNSAAKQVQLAFVGSSLYGIANGNAGAPTGTIYSINTTSGLETNLGIVAKYNDKALAIRDAAGYQAVPEPATIAALGLGALGALRRRKK